MTIPNKYQTAGEGAIASYDFQDVEEGTGRVTYQGFAAGDLGGSESINFLGRFVPFSNRIQSDASVPSGSYAEFDFTLSQFALNQTVNGICYFSIPWVVTNTAGTNNNYIQVWLRKWDGTTETTIGTVSGSAIQSDTASAIMSLMSIDVDNYLIRDGEQLRVTVGFEKLSAGNNPIVHICHDPMDRDGANITPSTDVNETTKLQVYIPYKLKI